jgi:hypothetical protein
VDNNNNNNNNNVITLHSFTDKSNSKITTTLNLTDVTPYIYSKLQHQYRDIDSINDTVTRRNKSRNEELPMDVDTKIDNRSSVSLASINSNVSTVTSNMSSTTSRLIFIDNGGSKGQQKDRKEKTKIEKNIKDHKVSNFISSIRDAQFVITDIPYLTLREFG